MDFLPDYDRSILVFSFKRRALESAYPRFSDPAETPEGFFDAGLEIL